jgi:hypothetical protein
MRLDFIAGHRRQLGGPPDPQKAMTIRGLGGLEQAGIVTEFGQDVGMDRDIAPGAVGLGDGTRGVVAPSACEPVTLFSPGLGAGDQSGSLPK